MSPSYELYKNNLGFKKWQNFKELCAVVAGKNLFKNIPQRNSYQYCFSH